MWKSPSCPIQLLGEFGAKFGGDLLSNFATETDHQNCLNAHFEASSAYWTDIYEFGDVDGTIYRQRRSVVLALAQKLALPAESPILEIGCGSGLTSVQLAREGYTIQAVDSVDAMIKRTRQHAEEACVGDRVITSMRDVYDLGYADNTFDLVLKIGVAPWLYSLEKAVREVVRVLRPGGYLITTADNWWRLNRWLDPRYLPPLAPMRRQVRNVLERLALIGSRGASARLHSIREFDDCLSAAGLTKIEGRTVGFGPFSFLGCKLLPDSFGVKVHHRMQDLADRGVPMLRSMGTHYIVLARKGVTKLAPPRRSPCVM
jgi:2-polyprenyl-3-methyl-5-hydroxy-6-metoxy-1,4-benzoquinol methylase